MNMKKKLLFLCVTVLAIINTAQAQNYQIGFAGTGASSTVDSVKVENLTQCTDINISGSDTLHLVASVGINELNTGADNTIHIYPNPMYGICSIDFEVASQCKTAIGLYDITGKRILQVHELLPKGNHTFSITGIRAGVYALKIESDRFSYTSKIISDNASIGKPEIRHIETLPASETPNTALNTGNNKNLQSGKSLIDMQYTAGDILKFTGFSGGIYKTVFMLVPAGSQTVTFNP
jgi:hypothetical protein